MKGQEERREARQMTAPRVGCAPAAAAFFRLAGNSSRGIVAIVAMVLPSHVSGVHLRQDCEPRLSGWLCVDYAHTEMDPLKPARLYLYLATTFRPSADLDQLRTNVS